jgi:hypothetical protein
MQIPEFVLLNVDSSITLWELVDIIGKHFKRSPMKITLKRMTKDKPELVIQQLCQSLGEIGFIDNEEIMVKTRPNETVKAILYNSSTRDISV